MKSFAEYINLNESSNFLTEGFNKVTRDLTPEQYATFQNNIPIRITKRGEVDIDIIGDMEDAIYASLMLFKFNYRQNPGKASPWDTDQFKLHFFRPVFKNGSIRPMTEAFLDDIGILNTKIFFPITYSMKYEFSGKQYNKDFINNFWVSILNFDPKIVKNHGNPKYIIGANESNRVDYGAAYWKSPDYPLNSLKMLSSETIWKSTIMNVLGPRFNKILAQLSKDLKLKTYFTP
ncbi:MAG: hypothetical protein LBD41_03515 [Clostridiales Family XIII bacterium]|jgi:hypothetical protein|nr:hypothetical protein [Clostridiales Family XIII bacterium]